MNIGNDVLKNLEDRDEKYVKEQIKKLLKKYSAYYHMPVQSGFGAPSLDFVGCHEGRFFAVEAKRPGKKMTPRQRLTMEMMQEAGGTVFLVGDDCIWEVQDKGYGDIRVAVGYTGMEALEGWLLLGP